MRKHRQGKPVYAESNDAVDNDSRNIQLADSGNNVGAVAEGRHCEPTVLAHRPLHHLASKVSDKA